MAQSVLPEPRHSITDIMILAITLKLKSPILGSVYKDATLRLLPRDDNGKVSTDYKHWCSSLESAASSLSLGDMADRISMPSSLSLPTVRTMERSFMPRGEHVKRTEYFESAPTGSSVTIPINFDGETHEIDDVKKLFSFVGTYHGMSYWGSRRGYGRFEVLNVTQTSDFYSNDASITTTSADSDGPILFGSKLPIDDPSVPD